MVQVYHQGKQEISHKKRAKSGKTPLVSAAERRKSIATADRPWT
jgi:hypothetical protein